MRLARVVVPGYPHHVTQRGNRCADVFFDRNDRRVYLSLLKQYADTYGLSVWAYCLMTNHVHFVVVPEAEETMACTFRDAHQAYAVYQNQRQCETGHFWQGRFFSCPLDEVHQWTAVRYVEQNPVRAGIVSRAEEYEWSSAAAHCGLRENPILAPDFPPPGEIPDWSAWLEVEDAAQVKVLRRRTQTGRPLGSEAFVDRLEAFLGRTLRPKKRGRRQTKKGDR